MTESNSVGIILLMLLGLALCLIAVSFYKNSKYEEITTEL
jgi:hypothetical protein